MRSNIDLVAIGEVMAELRRDDDLGFKVGFAGDTYNTAIYAKRALGIEHHVSYVTRVGVDPLSLEWLKMAKQDKLDLSDVIQDHNKSIGIYAVSTDANGERSFSYWRHDSAARKMFLNQNDIYSFPKAKIIYLSGITLAIMTPDARNRLMTHLQNLSNTKQSLIAFDSNYRHKLWESIDIAQDIISTMWDIADIAFPSIDDEMILFNEASEDVIMRFSQKTWQACAIKRGELGPISPTLAPNKHPHFQSAPKVIDTTAAGDSFNAGYLAALIKGQSERECLLSGHQLASRIVGIKGAIE